MYESFVVLVILLPIVYMVVFELSLLCMIQLVKGVKIRELK
jgi:hypothetical protein